MFFIPRTGNPYPAEFREQLVALIRTKRSVESLARTVVNVMTAIASERFGSEPVIPGVLKPFHLRFDAHSI